MVCALGVFRRLQAGGEDQTIMEEAVRRQFEVTNRKDAGETLRWFASLQLLQRLNTESGVSGWKLHPRVRSQDHTALKELRFGNEDRRVLSHIVNHRDRDGGLISTKTAREWLEQSSSGAR